MSREISDEEKARAKAVSNEIMADFHALLNKHRDELVATIIVIQLEAADAVLVGGGEEPGPRGQFMGSLREGLNEMVAQLSQSESPIHEGHISGDAPKGASN